MASVVGCEIEIDEVEDIEIHEVEIEQIPVELPIETVETSEEMVIAPPMIALQPLPEAAQEEIVHLQTTEEVVGDSTLVYVDNIPIPNPEIEICTAELPITNRKIKGGKKRGGKNKAFAQVVGDAGGIHELALDTSSGTRKWEQKQVQIKTLEGEFSVTMWASGKYVYVVLF